MTGGETDDESDDDDGPECAPCAPLMTGMQWGLIASKPPVKTNNAFDALLEEHISDEDREMIAALEQWAVVKPKKKVKNDVIQKRWLAKVTKDIQTLEKAEVPLEDDEYLCLVDSGCSKHSSNPELHFPGVPVEESPGQKAGQVFITANKQKLANLGQKKIRFTTDGGDTVNTVFQQLKIGMPILSVRQLGRTHRSIFADYSRNDGFMQNRASGLKTTFSSINGVYFMKVKIQSTGVQIPKPSFGGQA